MPLMRENGHQVKHLAVAECHQAIYDLGQSLKRMAGHGRRAHGDLGCSLKIAGDRQAFRHDCPKEAGNEEIPVLALLPRQDVVVFDGVHRELPSCNRALRNLRRRFLDKDLMQNHVASGQNSHVAAALRGV